MRRFGFKKLVRDGVFEGMMEEGGEPEYKVLEGQEKKEALLEKLKEEVEEIDLTSNDAELAEQFGDVSEVFQSLSRIAGITQHEVGVAKAEKSRKDGSFAGGYFVEAVGVPDDSPWLPHFLANPDRYPEIEP